MSPSIQRLHQLPYFEDSSALFETIVHRPWSVFLDSGHPGSQQGRYAILASDPIVTLVTQLGETTITRAGIEEVSTQDPFVDQHHAFTI
jgi:para-aminobenzoate synthetase component I